MYKENEYYGYEGMVDSFGVEVVLSEEDSDWQGDSFYLLKDASGRYGVLIFGWGSCSGCDAYQSAAEEGPLAVQELRDSLWNDVKWYDSLDDLRGDLGNRDMKLQWYGYSKTFKVYLKKLMEL